MEIQGGVVHKDIKIHRARTKQVDEVECKKRKIASDDENKVFMMS